MAFPEGILSRISLHVGRTETPPSPVPQVIEIPRDTSNILDLDNLRGLRYENTGMAYLEATTPSDRFIVGPALIDKSLHQGYPTGEGVPRIKLPDAMVFRPFYDVYVLEEMIEFKAGIQRYKSVEKLTGFKNLVEFLRKNPNHLNFNISYALGGREVPRLVVPNTDEEVEVHFVSARSTQPDFIHETDFRVFYWTLPDQQAA